MICPLSGKPAGLPTKLIAETDERSGGLTEVDVPSIDGTSPLDGESVQGTFRAVAETEAPRSRTRVALTIMRSRSRTPVFTAGDVSTRGATVKGLAPGSYVAVWKLVDVNGDTRTLITRFTQQPA
jgi:hypothetical protein